MYEIWPSLISADLLNLQATMNQLKSHCHGWHLDIMDNHFVPNLTWGASFINAIAQQTKKSIWIHLMIEDPLKFLDAMHIAKNSYVTFHIETKTDIHKLIRHIRAKKWRPSIAVNPDTPIEATFPFLDQIDQVLIMSVNPGFSGQHLIPIVLEKIHILKQELKKRSIHMLIALDGGINQDNIMTIARMGASQLAIASGIFKHSNPAEQLAALYSQLAKI